MCLPAAGLAVASLVTSAIGGGVAAYSAVQQGKYQQAVANNNATLMEFEADRASQRAEEEAHALRRQGAQMREGQRTTMAARGIDAGYGTSADILDQTDFFTQQDIATTRNNARVDRELARYGAYSERVSGANAKRAGNLKAFSTLLETGTKVAGKWYGYKDKGVF